jgi:hypothetical protein
MEEREPGGGDCTNISDNMHYRVALTLCFTHAHLQMPWKIHTHRVVDKGGQGKYNQLATIRHHREIRHRF